MRFLVHMSAIPNRTIINFFKSRKKHFNIFIVNFLKNNSKRKLPNVLTLFHVKKNRKSFKFLNSLMISLQTTDPYIFFPKLRSYETSSKSKNNKFRLIPFKMQILDNCKHTIKQKIQVLRNGGNVANL